MPVSHRSKSSVLTGTRTNTVVPAPADIQNGDLLELSLYIETLTATPPAGFTAFTGLGPLVFPVNNARLYKWWKRADGEVGDYTITHASAVTNALMNAYPGVVLVGSPEDVTPSINSGNANPIITATGINVRTPGSMLIWTAGFWNVPPDRPIQPPGVTPLFIERFNVHDNVDKWGLQASDGVVSLAGATGDKAGTKGPTIDDWVVALIALTPAVPALHPSKELYGQTDY